MKEDKLNAILSDDITDDELLELLSFIPAFDPIELHALGDVDFVGLELAEIMDADELDVLRRLKDGESGDYIYSELSKCFEDLKDVKHLMTNAETRSRDETWTKLDSVLQRYSSTMLRYGKDVYHYGSDLALQAVHPTAYYHKAWKLEDLTDDHWEEILRSLDDLQLGIYDASVGNMQGELDNSERAGITLERILRGNTVEPLQRKFNDPDEKWQRERIDPDAPALVPSPFAETGSTSTLKQMFPFFHYWSEKAEEFVNSEKCVNITMNVAKFFEDLNVTMHDKDDTGELEETIVKVLTRALSIAQSAAE